jgi:hypothetical protein
MDIRNRIKGKIEEGRQMFFEEMYEHCDLENGSIEIRTLPVKGVRTLQGKNQRYFHSISDTNEYVSGLLPNNDFHIYYGVGTREEGGGDTEHVLEIPILFTDSDFKKWDNINDLKNLIDEFPFEPTWVVGSGGGAYPMWKLNEPITKEGFKIWTYAQTQLEYYFLGDNVSDVPRILRVPFTKNCKIEYEKPRVCRILSSYTGGEFDIYDVNDFFKTYKWNQLQLQHMRKKTSNEGFKHKSFIQDVYQNKPYGAGERNKIVCEVIKYYFARMASIDEVFYHTMMFVENCITRPSKGENTSLYDEKDIEARVKSYDKHRGGRIKIFKTYKETEYNKICLAAVPKYMLEGGGK